MKNLAFTVLLFLLLTACYEYRLHFIETRLSAIEGLTATESDILVQIMEYLKKHGSIDR